MHSEHNPIAHIIHRMQVQWQQEIKPGTALVRWLLKADEHRMYEGFCRLEASPHGALDELFVFFYTPFETAETFSKAIIENWLNEIKAERKEPAADKNGIVTGTFNYSYFENRLSVSDSDGCDRLLVELMAAFRQLQAKSFIPLVLSILPKTISSPAGIGQWIKRFAKQNIPEGLRLLVFDHTEANYWQRIFNSYTNRAVTLYQELNLDAAIRQIATGGDARCPDVQFRRCLYEMGEAAARKQLAALHDCGKKMLEIGAGSGQKNLQAASYITYAGMLFTFKDFNTVQSLLDKGIQVCRQAMGQGDASIQPLLLQFYGYKAAGYQHQKNTKQALEWFMKQGKEAGEYGLYTESISAYHKAFLMAQFKNKYKEQAQALQGALLHTPFMQPGEIQSCEYPYIVYEYAQLVKWGMTEAGEDEDTVLQQAQRKMEEIYGSGWKETVRRMKLNFNKKEVQIMEAAAKVG